MPTDVFSLSICSCIVKYIMPCTLSRDNWGLKCKSIPLCAKLYNNVFVDMLTSATKAGSEMLHCYHYIISPKTGQYVLSWQIKLFYDILGRILKWWVNKYWLARWELWKMKWDWNERYLMHLLKCLLFFTWCFLCKRRKDWKSLQKITFHDSKLCCGAFCATFRSHIPHLFSAVMVKNIRSKIT